jgi:hypothetical protein
MLSGKWQTLNEGRGGDFAPEKKPFRNGQKIDDGMDIRPGITANHLLQHTLRARVSAEPIGNYGNPEIQDAGAIM